ncbi:homeobox protein BEL1-like protein [Iris pallida]|uniref:Homeobox protein BEL1-like protein n=1 Tax=Iris pallida TaxID=29817 RepID=A0AAX6E9E6_IRIPA|nr:homeobox protein BEL1-like protein [Iris pallida]
MRPSSPPPTEEWLSALGRKLIHGSGGFVGLALSWLWELGSPSISIPACRPKSSLLGTKLCIGGLSSLEEKSA